MHESKNLSLHLSLYRPIHSSNKLSIYLASATVVGLQPATTSSKTIYLSIYISIYLSIYLASATVVGLKPATTTSTTTTTSFFSSTATAKR